MPQHLQLHLQQPQPDQPATPPPAAAPSEVSLISGHAQKYVVNYALLAIAREPFELCSHFKSSSSVSRRELSIDLRWRASRPKPEFPAPEIETRIGCALGERGVKISIQVSNLGTDSRALGLIDDAPRAHNVPARRAAGRSTRRISFSRVHGTRRSCFGCSALSLAASRRRSWTST